jgi:hypothetical protein
VEAIGDLILILSTFAAAAALWFKFSSARAAKRALALIRCDAPQREPGLKVEVLGTTPGEMLDVEIRITNLAGAWNVITGLFLETAQPSKAYAAQPRDGALIAPLVIAASDAVTGHAFFRVRGEDLRGGSVVVVDLDERSARDPMRV